MDVLLARPRGFCAGVNRAIAIVNQALARYAPPVYVLHEIVHNTHVLEALRDRGAIFVEELEEIPAGSVTIFSAHGVSRATTERAKALGLRTIDATCPLVSKVHRRMISLHRRGFAVIVIGHKGHPEVEGTMGQSDGGMYLVDTVEDVEQLVVRDPDHLSFVTQTTLSVDDATVVIEALRKRFPTIQGPKKDDICYATQNRQDAVKALAEECDLVIVVGSPNSSNSKRLREVATARGVNAYLVDSAADVQPAWLDGRTCIGISAGASAPDVLVGQVIERIAGLTGAPVVTAPGIDENISFPLPRELALG